MPKIRHLRRKKMSLAVPWTDAAHAGSSKYKAYVQAVEKALKAFENSNEWADLISALGKLTKVFQSNGKFGDIPHPVTVAKRLSQCLHPALQNSVYLKALETYRQIFDIYGPSALPKYLYLYALGLFPLMEYCGIKVKSELFSIFEQYLLPLGGNLRPSLPGFLSAVLLGLEEGTEFYHRCIALLDKVSIAVGPTYFYSCLWQVILGSHNIRLPAMLYVNGKLDKSRPFEEQLHMQGEHVDIMVAALSAVAEDSGSALVQRHLLDFLTTAFPLDSTSLSAHQLVQLLRRCIFIVLRRDMSLNRRLYTWLTTPSDSQPGLEPEPEDSSISPFYQEKVLPLLVQALTEYLRLDTVELTSTSVTSHWMATKPVETHFTEVRVCRLLLYLLDRKDVGEPVLEKFFPIFIINIAEIYEKCQSSLLLDAASFGSAASSSDQKNLSIRTSPKGGQREHMLASSMSLSSMASSRFDTTLNEEKESEREKERRMDELSKNFNLLLSSNDPSFVWDFLADWIERLIDEESGEELTNCLTQWHMALRFCLSVCPLETVRVEILPNFFSRVLQCVAVERALKKITNEGVSTLLAAYETTLGHMEDKTKAKLEKEDDTTSVISFTDEMKAAFNETICSARNRVFDLCSALYSLYLHSHSRSPHFFPLLTAASQLLIKISHLPLYTKCKPQRSEISIHLEQWLNKLAEVLSCDTWSSEVQSGVCSDLPVRLSLLQLLITLYTTSSAEDKQTEENVATTSMSKEPPLNEAEMQLVEQRRIFEKSCRAVWLGLTQERGACVTEHVRMAEVLMRLHARKHGEPSSDVENMIASSLATNNSVNGSLAVSTFSRLWTLSRSCSECERKPFNRVALLLLSWLADDSAGREKGELRAAISEWLMDCARHDDLPGIIQMLCAMLMNPVTARISIQYVRLESRLTRERCPSLPADVSVVTLATPDGKHRMFHVVGNTKERPWLSDVRNRLLLSSEQQEASGTSGGGGASTAQYNHMPATSDVPIFDDEEDTDSLELCLEEYDPSVVEVMQYLIERTVEEEESAHSTISTNSTTDEERERILDYAGGAENIPPTGAHGGPNVWRKLDSATSSGGSQPRETTIVPARSLSEMPPLPVRPMRVGDTVGRLKKGHRRQDSLQESIFSMTEKDLKSFDTTDILRPSDSGESNSEVLFSDLYVHLLLYGESGRVVDLGRAEGAFRILSALIRPRTFSLSRQQLLRCLVSSGTATSTSNHFGSDSPFSSISQPNSPNGGSLVELMTKHVRAILGQHFWSPASDEDAGKQRHLTLLELIITICLHFLRSFFLDSPVSPVTEDDLLIACKCKIAALDLLCDIFDELCEMLKEQQSRSFVLFVQAVLSRSKMQKSILHFLMTSVSEPRLELEPNANIPLAVSVCEFNESLHGTSKRLQAVMTVYQRCLLALTGQAIRLECDIKNGLNNFSDESLSSANRIVLNEKLYMPTSGSSGLLKNPPIVELRAFVLTLLNALKRRPRRHETWLQLIVHIVPWLERSLPTLLVRIAEQLCKNINNSLVTSFNDAVSYDRVDSQIDFGDLPANYIEMLMEMLTTLVHYCITSDSSALLSAPPQQAITQSPPTNTASSMVGQAIYAIPGTKGATELFGNLVKVFSSNDSSSSAGIPFSKMEMRQRGELWRQARNDMLTSLPHMLATVCDLWTVIRQEQAPRLPVGSLPRLNRLVLDLLSPIASYHQHALLNALSLVWLSRSNTLPLSDEASFEYSSSQMDVTHLVFSLKGISFDRLVTVVADTLKDVGAKSAKMGNQAEKASFPNETPLLELLHSYMQLLPVTSLVQRWQPLLALLSDAPLASLNPRAIFLLFKLLCDFVRLVGAAQIVDDKAMSRCLQEACQRLTDAINGIVAWQLETTTWLKRTLVVKQELTSAQTGSRSHDSSPLIESISLSSSVQAQGQQQAALQIEQPSISASVGNRGSTASLLINKNANGDINAPLSATPSILADKRSSSNLRASLKDTNNNKRDPAFSTQALFLLANNLAELIDSICRSDDKEKMVPTLQAVWNNVVPYLKAKNARNARFFFASSQLLATMSSFSYTRTVWKKTTLELLLDTSFFKMDRSSLQQWLIVADHLMSHDKTSFKDLLKSISYTPNASFSLMTTKEQEYEARAAALKRLAFVVFGSQLDQYSTQSNDILEKLTENLRVSQCAAIRSAVFLCVRVLLLRLRPNSLTGVWPLMVSELVTALLQLEQQLASDGHEEDSESWMQLHLAASKLLETLFTLPLGYLTQFQMCNWTFMPVVGMTNGVGDKTTLFVPFAIRINGLLEKRFGRSQLADTVSVTTATSSPSLFHIKMLTSYEELRPFYSMLATKWTGYKSANAVVNLNGKISNTTDCVLSGLSHKAALSRLEHSLYIDFAEHWQL